MWRKFQPDPSELQAATRISATLLPSSTRFNSPPTPIYHLPPQMTRYKALWHSDTVTVGYNESMCIAGTRVANGHCHDDHH